MQLLTLEHVQENEVHVNVDDFAGGYLVSCYPLAMPHDPGRVGSSFDFDKGIAISKALGEFYERQKVTELGTVQKKDVGALIMHGQLGSSFAFERVKSEELAYRELCERFLRFQIFNGSMACEDSTDSLPAVAEFGERITRKIMAVTSPIDKNWLALVSENYDGSDFILSSSYETDVKSRLMKAMKEQLMLIGAYMLPGLAPEKFPFSFDGVVQLTRHSSAPQPSIDLSASHTHLQTFPVPHIGYVSVCSLL
jgi:hypothetical protein